jgi:hypothetical protein
MKFQCKKILVNGVKVTLYTSEYKGKKFTGTFQEAYLFALGYGCDQAAELRYEMSRIHKADKTAVNK